MTHTDGDIEHAEPSLWQGIRNDLKDIFAKFGLLASAVGLLTLGVSFYISNMLDPYKRVVSIVILMVPMVCSATILIMLVMRKAYAGAQLASAVWITVAAIVVPYLIAVTAGLTDPIGSLPPEAGDACYVLSRDCPNPVPPPLVQDSAGDFLQYLHPMKALSLAYGILKHYFSFYGLPHTLAAVLCGAFLAWVYEKRLLPRAREIKARVKATS